MRKNKQQSKNSIKYKSRVPFILFATIPVLINFLIFYVYMNFSSFGMAFINKDGQLSIENFLRIIREFQLPSSMIRLSLRNTFLTFGISLIAFPFRVLVPYFLYKKIPLSGFYRVVFFLPGIIFSVCVSLVFTRMIGPTGFIAKAVGDWLNLGYAPELLADSRFANITVILHMLWLGFPGDLIIWSGTFARIPEEVLEAGQIDGTTWITEFSKIILPMVWPTVTLKMVLMFCGIFSASGQVFLLTEGQYGTSTLSSWMYIYLLEHGGASYESNAYNYLSAMGVVITVLALTLSTIVRKIASRMNNDVEF